MKKELFLKIVSKIEQTGDDEFMAIYNSPNLIFPVVEKMNKTTAIDFAMWLDKNNHRIWSYEQLYGQFLFEKER